MLKKELLLGGGGPYADATHWLLVGTKTEGGSTYYGYDNGHDGAVATGGLTPDTFNGYYVHDFYEVNNMLLMSLSKDWPGSSFGDGIGNIRVTNLLNGESHDFSYSSWLGYYSPTNKFDLPNQIGKKIPIKMELI